MDSKVEIYLPCLICGDDAAALATAEASESSNVKASNFVNLRAKFSSMKDSPKFNDDNIFQCFFKLFKVDDLDWSNEADCSGGGEDSRLFQFCGTCKTQLGNLLELQFKVDELKKQIEIGTKHLKEKMVRSEGTFDSEEIYKSFPRYRRVRCKIVDKELPVAMVTNQQNLPIKVEFKTEREPEADWSPSSNPPDSHEFDNTEDIEDEPEKESQKNRKVKYVEDPQNNLITYDDTYTFQFVKNSEKKNDQLKCTLCDLIIPYKKPHIRRHVFKVHTDKFVCSKCPWRFPTAPRLRAHVQSVHEGNRKKHRLVECTICGKPVPTNHYKQHQWSHKSKEEKEEALKDPSLAREIPRNVRDNKEKKYQCDKCEERFSIMYSLKKHQERKHRDPEERKQLCPECGKSVLHLRTHLRLMHSEDDGVVDLMKTCLEPGCGKRFLHLGDLTRHKNQVHRKLKPFQCTECGKCFGEKYNLKQHVKTIHKK